MKINKGGNTIKTKYIIILIIFTIFIFVGMLFYEGNKPDPKIPKNYYDYKKHHVNAFQDFCYTEEYYYDSNIEEELKKQSYEQVTNENIELVEKLIDIHKKSFQSLNEQDIISDDNFESYTFNNLQVSSDDLVFYTYRTDEDNKNIIYYYRLYYYSKKTNTLYNISQAW